MSCRGRKFVIGSVEVLEPVVVPPVESPCGPCGPRSRNILYSSMGLPAFNPVVAATAFTLGDTPVYSSPLDECHMSTADFTMTPTIFVPGSDNTEISMYFRLKVFASPTITATVYESAPFVILNDGVLHTLNQVFSARVDDRRQYLVELVRASGVVPSYTPPVAPLVSDASISYLKSQ